jgi:hypothetical protein
MRNQRANLIHALESIAKFHLADDPSAQVDFMDTSEELCARWNGAYVNRDWFMEQFSAEQRATLTDFDAYVQALSAKYNKLPPILKFVTSADGQNLCSRAAKLLTLLRPA